MKFTRRDKHVLIAIIALVIMLAFIPQQTINNHEVFFMVVIVGPLGLYIATDPERRKAG